jgi:alcohol dehydrogenase (cytochrome c)
VRRLLIAASVALGPIVLAAQGRGVDPADLLKPLTDSWPTYSGDYSGKRFSALKLINHATVKHLTLAWSARLTDGPGGGGRFGGGGGRPVIVGGEGSGDFPVEGNANVKATPLMIDGTLYITTPDNAWALDAHDGRELWHYFWKTRGGTHIANRGVGIWHDYVFMETPDNYLVSLEAKTGKERWHKVIASFEEQYFSTTAPVIVGNHIIVGTGNDLDEPGFLQSFDPETGELQWKLYTVPMNPGDPGADTWPSIDAARHGGAQPWLPGAYDPETKLYIFGTGNPTPAYTPGRGEGDNLFTCSLVAVNVDTGKMAWYFQTSPHDMHDWDSAQTPILIDAVIKGKPRKLVSTAARNGYFFTIDRVTGEHVVTSKYGLATNWVKEVAKNGSLRRNPVKDASIGGALVSPTAGGTINWEPPAYSPQTGLFYVSERNGYSLFYLIDVDPRGSMGLGGVERVNAGSAGNFLTAIDPKTGKIAWRHRYPSANDGGGGGGGGGGLLATAGRLVFGGDAGGNIVAYDAATGTPLWHSRIGSVSNPPITYMLDGRQYLLVAAGDMLYAFTLY